MCAVHVWECCTYTLTTSAGCTMSQPLMPLAQATAKLAAEGSAAVVGDAALEDTGRGAAGFTSACSRIAEPLTIVDMIGCYTTHRTGQHLDKPDTEGKPRPY